MAAQPARFWVGLLVALALTLWLLRHILLPFVLGMAVGYLLDPLVDRVARRGIPRAAAAGVMVVVAYGGGILAIVLLTPVVVRQIVELVASVPAYARAVYEDLSPVLQRLEARPGGARVTELATAAAQHATDLLGPLAAGLLGRGLAVLDLAMLLAITPLVAFYLLRDWPKLVTEVDGWLPRAHVEVIRGQARAIDAVLAGFARGTAIVCAILALYYAVALTLVGLPSGLAIGLAAGAVSFVPYLGTLGGAAAAIGVAAYQFWPAWGRIVVVGGIFAAGQLLNDYVLTPNLVGDKVGLHPLWVLFALFAGGALLGFAGVVIAVPVSAVIGVLARFAIGQYKESSLYRGDAAAMRRTRSPAP
jgi:predicted PurR-regulated permease PerM